MKIILSSNIDHYKYTALSLQKHDKLLQYYCGAFYKNKPWYLNINKSLKKWILQRTDNELNFNYVYSFRIYELLYKALRNSIITKSISKTKIDILFNNIFDLLVMYKIRKYKDVDYFHYVSSIGYKSACKIKKYFNCKVIVDDRAEHKGFLKEILEEEYKLLDYNYNFDEFWEIDCRKEYDLADYIIVPSSYSKQTFIKQGISADKLVVIPYGCDIEKFYPVSTEKDEIFRIIYVGSLCARKGVIYLIEAFKMLDLDNIELLIIGKVEEDMKAKIHDLPNGIKIIPYVVNNELINYYSKSSVFVLPSLSDSFSLATLEAMASGLPVIISEHVGAKDFITHGQEGYIVPIRDSESIAHCIKTLYLDKSLQKKMSYNARKTVEKATWNNYEQKINEFYEIIHTK